MALSNINVGTVANDGTGDTVRAAFQKVNANNALFSTVALTGAYADLSGKPALATVATSGSYTDLTSKPTLAPMEHPGYVAGNWYLPFPTIMNTGAVLPTNVARFIAFIPEQTCTISQLGVRITTGTAATNCQLAIYASDATTKRPTGAVLQSTPAIATTGAGSVTSAFNASATQQVTAGALYWLAINTDSSANVFSISGSQGYVNWIIGSATAGTTLNNPTIGALTTPLTYNTWSDVTSATWTEITTGAYAMIEFKVASIP